MLSGPDRELLWGEGTALAAVAHHVQADEHLAVQVDVGALPAAVGLERGLVDDDPALADPDVSHPGREDLVDRVELGFDAVEVGPP